jgi:aminopeptidase N
MANYSVDITANSNLKLASTCNINNTTNNSNNTTTYNISALAVRDFAFVLSANFNIVTDKIDDTVVNYYYYNNQYPNECLRAGMDSISTFNKLFGKYPYSVINIVETNFVHGGMEYPNMVMISDAVDIQSDYINVIVHEVAHQWWYGLVGNNEFDYGWLDEGLTEYSTVLFYEQNPSYGVDTDLLIKNTTNSFTTFVEVYNKVFGTADTTMNRALDEYNNESEYVYIAYVKGMLLFDSVKEIMGYDKFISALQEYFDSNKFKIATPETLISAFEKSSGDKLSSLFESWINGKVKIIPIK